QLGTDDIVRIVREYRSPTFGFASRNFYVSFLAALSIAQDPDKYFGPLHRGSESQFVEVKLSTSASSATLVRTLGVDRDTLRGLNPALRPGVWTGQRSIPAGYVVRLPGSASKWTSDLLAQRLGASKPVVVAEVTPPANVLPPATSARPTAPPTQLTALNSMPDQDYMYGGERLRLVAAAPEPETETTAANVDSAKAAVQESQEEAQAVAAASKVAANTEPVSAAQAQAQGPQLVPGTTGPESADPVDYSVAADGSIRVVAAETLGHYADWLGTSATRLRALNKLRGRTPVVMGRRMKL